MEKIIETIQSNTYLEIAVYVLGGFLAINLLLTGINFIRGNKKAFGLQSQIVEFLRKVIVELRLVTWLSGKETIRLTFIVIIVAIIFGGFIALLDLGFFKLRDLLI